MQHDLSVGKALKCLKTKQRLEAALFKLNLLLSAAWGDPSPLKNLCLWVSSCSLGSPQELLNQTYLHILLCDLDLSGVDVINQLPQGLPINVFYLNLLGLTFRHVSWNLFQKHSYSLLCRALLPTHPAHCPGVWLQDCLALSLTSPPSLKSHQWDCQNPPNTT